MFIRTNVGCTSARLSAAELIGCRARLRSSRRSFQGKGGPTHPTASNRVAPRKSGGHLVDPIATGISTVPWISPTGFP
jgi:hypothetical protein